MGLIIPHCKKLAYYEMPQRALDFNQFFGMIYAMDRGHKV
jgi:hypothetical protein